MPPRRAPERLDDAAAFAVTETFELTLLVGLAASRVSPSNTGPNIAAPPVVEVTLAS
jgi:hypothetical protein